MFRTLFTESKVNFLSCQRSLQLLLFLSQVLLQSKRCFFPVPVFDGPFWSADQTHFFINSQLYPRLILKRMALHSRQPEFRPASKASERNNSSRSACSCFPLQKMIYSGEGSLRIKFKAFLFVQNASRCETKNHYNINKTSYPCSLRAYIEDRRKK